MLLNNSYFKKRKMLIRRHMRLYIFQVDYFPYIPKMESHFSFRSAKRKMTKRLPMFKRSTKNKTNEKSKQVPIPNST